MHQLEAEEPDADPENGYPQTAQDESEGVDDQHSEAYVNNQEYGEDAAAATYDDATALDYTSADPHYATSTASVYDNPNAAVYADTSEDANAGQFPNQYEYDNTYDHQQYDYDQSQTEYDYDPSQTEYSYYWLY